VSLRRFGHLFPVLVCVFGFLLFGLSPAYAGDGFQPISAEELKMTAEPKAPGAAAIILYRQVDRDDSGHTAHEDNYIRIKILKEEGRKYADIEIPYYKERGNNVVNVRARTIRPNGTIVNFEGKVFDKQIAKAKGLKYLAKTFTLPEVEVGSIIEYYYTYDLSEHYVYDSHWILSQDLFTKSAKFSLKPYSSSYSNLNVRWSWQGLPAGTTSPAAGPDRVVRLEVKDVPAFETEDFMPPQNELKARVDFTYSEDRETDPAKYWQRVGKHLNDVVEGFVGKHKAMEQAAGQIVSPSDPPEVKLRKIYARVQQLRNTSYEVRKSEQEQKRANYKDAENVEDVWKRGSGDRAQLTWLYLGLVRAAGFEAYPVMVSDRRNYFFNPRMMDRTRLDANVVVVKLDGKDIYCDPGAAFTAFGMLEWSETAARGLRLDKDGGTWVVTNLPDSSASRIERTAKLTLSETGDVDGKLTLKFTGLEAMRQRLEERNDDDADRRKFLEDEVRDYIPAACEVELSNKPDWTSSDAPLIAEFSLKIPGWVSGSGRHAMVPVGLFTESEKHIFEHTNRTHPIYFQYPYTKTDDVILDLPLGWQISTLPQPQGLEGRVVAYSFKAENEKGSLHLSRKLSIDTLLLESKYYPALRSFFQVVRTGDDEQVVLQPINTAAVH
jgi:Domain of Unknown Function with PDB structure (DUF3857)